MIRILEEAATFAPAYTIIHVALFCSDRYTLEFLEMHSLTKLNNGML